MATTYKRKETPKNLLLPGDIAKHIYKLESEAAGELLKAAYRYYDSEEEPELEDLALSVLFERIKLTMDYGRSKYADMCESQKARRNARSKKAELIEEINEFFEVFSIYEYSQYIQTDSTKVERFLETMEELRISELEEFVEKTKQFNEHMIEELRSGRKITPFQNTGTE